MLLLYSCSCSGGRVCGSRCKDLAIVSCYDILHAQMVDQLLMVLTTQEGSCIIILGIVISILPISSILLLNSYHISNIQICKKTENSSQSRILECFKTDLPNQCTSWQWSQWHIEFQNLARIYFQRYTQFQCSIGFQHILWTLPLQYNASSGYSSAVAMWISQGTSEQPLWNSSQSLHLPPCQQNNNT